jgi:3',5'-cyclic-AMP phosphodiesterase
LKKALYLVAAALWAASCLRPSEDRAERDLEVGQAERQALSVSVKDGLAVVRALGDDSLVLWGSAPSFEVTLSAAKARTLTLEIQNCMSDVELDSLSAAAALTPLESDGVATRKRWQVELPAGETRLGLAAPDAQANESFRFALLSDVQEAIVDVADVFDAINESHHDRPLRFLLGAGDLTERGSRAELERYQRELLRLKIPYFTTLGNHELGQSPDLFHEYFGRGSFQFLFHGVYFTLLDSASASLDPLVYDWLDDWLSRAQRDVHIVAMHIPPIDPIGVRNGSWGSRNEAAKLLARLAKGRVDLTLYGHVHSYYEFDNAGIQAYISGGGGAIPERFDRIGRHFMVFTADPREGITDTAVVRVD